MRARGIKPTEMLYLPGQKSPRECDLRGRGKPRSREVCGVNDTTAPHRTCSKCGLVFPETIEFFSAHKSSRRGLLAWCRQCESKRLVDWREAHPGYARQYNQAYYLANRDEIVARAKDDYIHNRDARLATGKMYAKTHAEMRRVYDRNREAKKHGNGGTHTAADITAQRERQRGKCFYCGGSWVSERCPNGHIDHVVPLHLGGSNGPENLVVACEACNQQKHTAHPMDYCGRLL